ncbi:MAG: hydrogenase maturation nickel metallochaperone HypA [Bacteroidetes bacterium]|nr:hydrogenase maturation nickel metallochaperone HypA [Bacteroidota bacterium]
MHELSIVMNIIDIATEQVQQAHARKVDSIELEIGTMAGVEMDALDFSWSAAVRNTVLSDAERVVDRVPAIARCGNCGLEFRVSEPFMPCPACDNVLVEYLQGKELRVKSLVVS